MQTEHRDRAKVLETPKEISCPVRQNGSPDETETCAAKSRGAALAQQDNIEK